MNISVIQGADKMMTLGLKSSPSLDPIDLTNATTLVFCFSQSGSDELEKKRLHKTGDLTSGLATILNMNLDDVMVGDLVTHPDVPVGTKILSIDTLTGIVTMDHNATATLTGAAIVIGDVVTSGSLLLGKSIITLTAAETEAMAEGTYSIQAKMIISGNTQFVQFKDALQVLSKTC